MANSPLFIFDFDSTFIQVESLDILAQICLANHPESKQRQEAIHRITELAMEGRLPYQESLQERISLLNIKHAHIEQTIDILKKKITPSFERNRDFFKQNADSIYIISGAFIEFVLPIVQPFGIKREHVFANKLLYDFESNIVGFDENYVLAQDQGKIKLAHQLKLKDAIIIGDGYNDYEIKAAGLASAFLAFTENVSRKAVIEQADAVLNELEGLFLTCNIPYNAVSTNKRVLLLENIHPIVEHHFNHLGYEVESLPHSLEANELIKKIENVSILGIRSKTEITADVINRAPKLEAVGAFCIGTNQIDLAHCSQKGIAAFNAPFSNTRSVVELALAEMILLVRKAAALNNKLIKGQWHKTSQDAHEIRGKTLGIIGYGNIGSQLSILAESLGMRVLFYDIEDKLPLGNAQVCHTLEELLSLADVISIHVDGRKENHHFISTTQFELMKNKVIFLNLSRGNVVDYDALIAQVKSGKIGGVGIDVYPLEPNDSKSTFSTPLQQFDNVILTPHIGGSTEEAQQHIGEYVFKNLHAYSSDGSSIGSVNFPQLNLPTMNYPQRIIHIHKNVPGILAQINGLFAKYETNIEGQFLKTNDNIGYVITDTNHEVDDQVLQLLEKIPHTIKVRKLNKYL